MIAAARQTAASLLLALLACAHAAPEPPRPAGIPLAWSLEACARADADADRDGLDDRCELALAQAFAQAFAPELVVDARDCLWRADAAPPRPDGGYLFAAQRTTGGVRIAFLPAYYRDCGWSGAVCLLRGGDCGAHDGDSELIVVDVVASAAPARWETVGVFLSAHCFGRSGGRCRWFRGDALRAFAWADGRPGGAPRVWVARGKHAHYPSRRACDSGHWLHDSCDGNAAVVRFPVVEDAQNVGSRQHPRPSALGCIASEALPLGAAGARAGARECVWDPDRPFRGWQGGDPGAGPTPYARVLERAAGF